LLGKINGVFFPGGEMPIDWSTDWTKKTAFIFEYAKKQNQAGNVYPIWATCLGYETIMYITSGRTDNTTVFTEVFGQDGLSCPLIVKNRDSKLLRSLNNPEYADAVNGDGFFFFHHRWSVMEETFNKNSNWTSFWNLVSTSKTNYGAEFLSTLEAKDYPFFLTQYHPEKNSYEWRVPAKRTYNSISAEQKFINVFVSEARKNKNHFPAAELSKKVIYNYHPILTPLDYAFVQVYVFDERNLS
jgi:gamma-glutamyl hydrolase